MKKLTKVSIIIVSTVFLILVLASCSRLDENPVEIIRFLDEESYDSEVVIDSDGIEFIAEEAGIREKDVEWIIAITPEEWEDQDESGVLVFCVSNAAAKEMVEDLEDFVDDNKDFEEDVKRFTIERKGKYVFFGCEDVWELISYNSFQKIFTK